MTDTERGHWVRWFAVLPAAIAALLVTTVVWALVFALQRALGELIPASLHYVANSAISTAAFVAAGSAVAPWWRIATACSLSLLAVLGTSGAVYYRIYISPTWPVAIEVLALLASIVGSSAVLIQVWRARD